MKGFKFNTIFMRFFNKVLENLRIIRNYLNTSIIQTQLILHNLDNAIVTPDNILHMHRHLYKP